MNIPQVPSCVVHYSRVCRQDDIPDAAVLTLYLSRAKRDFVLPVSEAIPGVNGSPVKEIPVPKGTTIYIGIRASNLDKRIWGEDALEFKPERWLAPLPSSLTEARIPGVYSHL